MNRELLCKLILAGIDFMLTYFSFSFSIELINIFSNNFSNFLPQAEYLQRELIHIVLSLLCVAWFWIRLRHYTYRKPFWFELKEIIRTLLIFAIFELAIIAFSKLSFSRYLWGLTWIIALILVPVGRFLIKKILIKLGYYIKDTVIIGTKKNALDAYNALMREPYLGLKIKYFVNVDNGIVEKAISDTGIKIVNENKMMNFLKPENFLTQFIIALEEDEEQFRDLWFRKLSKQHYRSVSIVATMRGIPLYNTDMSFIFSYEVMLLRVHNNLAKRTSRFLKRTMDIVGSLSLIILLSPLLITLYYLVSRDGGNAIYGHTRIGRNKKAFKCLKFRSMVLNSQELLQQLLEKDPLAREEWQKDFKLKNDPRITKVGYFLRKTSLDELPQLFNVLKGEMSLVGPRPIVRSELARYNDDVDYYLMAKPGMTGLWQVSGRNDVDYITRVYYDAWYVKNWSIWNDIVILFKTIKVVLNRSGAY
ncbi:undecaprenyl-phosphate galactose phosphotransferase WbaP [Gallibacterium anatis]|uniref:undecaprenyl-phosphate galactose phosphotransferase WbaP n=1 Tax=Gallibacterium anatis TaxID=750 RepID=UPI001B31F710|nr:undecaprenyl-phosphate galactose phosphotransferase WbaP [Gallibacterium anatis]MBP4133351.1 undecaprenyl-phosphate galactose phosphotransferase WbaP [Gallibacterium anatis]